MLPTILLGLTVARQETQQNLQGKPILAVSVPNKTETPNAELLLVDVLYGSLRLTNSLQVLQTETGLKFLPLKELSKSLNFHLYVVPSLGQATGFLCLPKDRFDLKAKLGICKRNDESIAFDPNMCFEKDGELYIESHLLAFLTEIQFLWRLNRLELEVKSKSPLGIKPSASPIQPRIELAKPEKLEVVKSEYQAISTPSFDLQYYSGYSTESGTAERNSSFTLTGNGDLGYMNAKYRFSAGRDGRLYSGFSLGREDFTGSLLGALRATRFEFGDLYFSPVSLFSQARSGRGLTITNTPLFGYSSDSTEKISGNAKPGSTIELYRENQRVATSKADETGFYSFEGIFLQSGLNKFLLVEITTDGEVLQEERSLYGNSSGPKPGETRYSFTAAQLGEGLFGKSQFSNSASTSEIVAQFQRGLSSGSWLSATIGSLDGSGKDGMYYGAGYYGWGGSAQWHLNSMLNEDGGLAVSAGMFQRFGNNSVSLEHTRLSGNFQGSTIPEIQSNADSVTKLRIDGSGKLNGGHFSYGLSADRYDGSSPSTLLRARLSGGNSSIYVSNYFSARFTDEPFSGSGLLQIRKKFDKSSARFDLGYGVGDNSGIHTARLALDTWISADYRFRYGLELDDSRRTSLSAIGTIYRAFGPVFLGLNLSVNANGGITTNLLLTAGVAGEEGVNSLQLVRPGSTELGSVSLRVFLDKNLNGVFDEGDQLLPNIGIRVGRSPSGKVTDEKGACTLEKLRPNQEIVIALNEFSLNDPCWMPEKPGKIVILRPGSMVRTDFAVIETTEIEGHIQGITKNTGYTVELVDEKGEVKQLSYVDDQFDYVFSHVRPADYTLRLKDAAGNMIEQRKIKALPASYLKGIDFHPKVDTESIAAN